MSVYGNKVRVRACGLCWDQDKLLLVNHRGLRAGAFWAPPGGGVEFGQSLSECLQKEFLEETGLFVSVGRFMFGCEFIHHPLHSIELFFEVSVSGGVLHKGDDPEYPIIEAVRFVSAEEIATMPASSLHGLFGLAPTREALMTLSGFFRI